MSSQLKEVLMTAIKKMGYFIEENYDRGQAFDMFKDQEYFCSFMRTGRLWHPENTNFYMDIQKIAKACDEIKRLYKQYEEAPPLHCEGLSTYHVLSEHGDVVLACKIRKDHCFELVTWRYYEDRTSVFQGHYFDENYKKATLDFISRSGLIPKSMMFQKEELKLIYQCCLFRCMNDSDINIQEEQKLRELIDKIEAGEWNVTENAERTEDEIWDMEQ